MKYNPEFQHRRSMRLQGRDYSLAGAYFITLCTQDRECLFGEIVDGDMRLDGRGQIVADEWKKTPIIRPNIQLDAWVVMPNHFHGILVVEARKAALAGSCGMRASQDPQHATTLRSPAQTIGAIIRGFKSAVTKRINHLCQTPNTPLWQRNYHERIIRNAFEMNQIREYIQKNPMRWETDSFFDARKR